MHALHAYSGMQHYSTTGRVLACTSSSYPPSTYSYGALLVMQRIMSFCLLVHTLHSTHEWLATHPPRAQRGTEVWHSRSMHTPRVPAYLQGRHAGHPGVYAYTCTTGNSSIRRTHTQNGPRERWPHLCMHSRECSATRISTCRPAEHYSILLCRQREHVALLVS